MRILGMLAAILVWDTALAAPITLDGALALAARNNLDLQGSRAAAEGAAAELYGSYQGVLPRLDLSVAAGESFVSDQLEVGLVPHLQRDPVTGNVTDVGFAQEAVMVPSTRYGAHQVKVTLSWSFFDGLASWNRIAAARAGAEAAARQADEAQLQLAFDVTRRYYEVIKQERALSVRRDAVTWSEELVGRADALFAAGRGTKADTFSARANLAADRIAVEAQSELCTRARIDLELVLGMPATGEIEVTAPEPLQGPLQPATRAPPPLETLTRRALAARPLAAAQQLSAEAAEREVARARGGYWPVLGIVGSYDRQSSNLTGPDGLLGDPLRQYTATVQATLSWNLFAGRETTASVRRSEAAAQQARLRADQSARTIEAEVARAREHAAVLARAAALAQANLETAQRVLELARERLEAGVGSQLEVRDAVVKAASARLVVISTVVDYIVGEADLLRAVGGPP